jgi:DNA invertase Pin-like site-specific DNA recombinase
MAGRTKRAAPGDPKRAIAYLRVSTDRQEHGPEAQRATLTAWAERGGIQIVDWIEEKESGAATIEERPELQKALAALSTNGAGMLLAAKRDRIAREVTIARDIAEHVRGLGAIVVTADGMSDTEDRPDSFLKQGISDLFAEHERRQIADRTKAALAVMRAKGLNTGKAPYGFQIAASGPPSKKSGRSLRLAPSAAEQGVCALVMNMHEAGASERTIEDELKALGVKSRKGHRLNQTQVHRIIVGEAARAELLAALEGLPPDPPLPPKEVVKPPPPPTPIPAPQPSQEERVLGALKRLGGSR